MEKIQFFSENIDFTIKHKMKLRSWIKEAIEYHHKKIQSINYIFHSDNAQLSINKEYLAHDTYTDIITFDQSSDPNQIEADIYISIERVKENAKKLSVSFEDELHRVMIHGILHLLGYSDKNEPKKKEMRKKENHYLALRF